MTDNPDLDHMYDRADDEFRRAMQDREQEIFWALAEAARTGTPPKALEVLEKATGVHL